MGLRMKNLNIMGVHLKIRFLGGLTKKQYIEENCLKRGGLDLTKKRGMVFLKEGWYPNAYCDILYIYIYIYKIIYTHKIGTVELPQILNFAER